MPKEKKQTYLSAVQVHQEVGGTDHTFQELADHVRSISEEYAAKGSDVVGVIDGEIHSKMAKMKTCYWFRKRYKLKSNLNSLHNL